MSRDPRDHRLGHDRDAEPAPATASGWVHPGWGCVGVAGHHPRHDADQCGRVGGVSAKRPVHRQPGHVMVRWAVAHPAAARLEARDAAGRRGNPHGSPGVGAVGDRRQACRDGRGRAPAGAARRVPGRPGIAGGRGDPVLRVAGQRELRRVGRAEDDEAALLHARHHVVVGVGGLTGIRGRAARAAHVLDPDQVLDRDRHPVQRSQRLPGRPRAYERALGRPRLPERQIPGDRHERADRRIECPDPVQVVGGGLGRGKVPGADCLPLLQCGQLMDVAHAAHAPSRLPRDRCSSMSREIALACACAPAPARPASIAAMNSASSLVTAAANGFARLPAGTS